MPIISATALKGGTGKTTFIHHTAGALALAGKRILETAIREFAGSGGTVVWINHDLAQVQQIADAVTCIDQRVVLDGAPLPVIAEGVARGLFPGAAPLASRSPATAGTAAAGGSQ